MTLMMIKVTTEEYDFTLTSKREDTHDISDIFNRVAATVAALEAAAKKAEAMVVDNERQ